ncbi:MAG TPA: type II asparaginase [Burkholderiaceae bacterium]|jgi:L-asparaginase|nr:type II asparaginase [Burkholderiaceae bacterium]
MEINLKRLISTVMVFNALVAASSLSTAQESKPGVVIYATGGTIAASPKSRMNTTNYTSDPKVGVEMLVNAVPELKDVATVTGEQIANVSSSDVSQAVLLQLARTINAKLADPAIHGAVITHGTDTLEETAFFLDLTVNQSKPVVVVGAMRPATAVSADGPMNLLEAVTLAASKEAENRGVLVLLNDRIGSAFYTTKTNSTALDTFRAVEQGYLGVFIGSTPRFYFGPSRPLGKPAFDVSRAETLPKVAILYGHQDQDIALIDAALKDGAKGIVFAGGGNGALSTAIKKKVTELMQRGIPVIRSTRTGSGFVSRKDEGIGSGFYNPQKARILLALALAEGASMEKIRMYFGS